MSRRLPATRVVPRPVVHYADPANQHLMVLTDAELAAKAKQDRILIARWRERRRIQRERDRKVRRFWLGFGAVIALAALAGLLLVGWFIWQALTAISLGVLAVPAVIVLALLLGIGGHRCVTVVQHWH